MTDHPTNMVERYQVFMNALHNRINLIESIYLGSKPPNELYLDTYAEYDSGHNAMHAFETFLEENVACWDSTCYSLDLHRYDGGAVLVIRFPTQEDLFTFKLSVDVDTMYNKFVN